jgi:hypothetical protein
MSHRYRIKIIPAAFSVLAAIPAGRWVWHTRPRESATERAHRVCGAYGLGADEIDRVLAKLFDFTDDEVDFIINCDIKYRMGRSDGNGDE